MHTERTKPLRAARSCLETTYVIIDALTLISHNQNIRQNMIGLDRSGSIFSFKIRKTKVTDYYIIVYTTFCISRTTAKQSVYLDESI